MMPTTQRPWQSASLVSWESHNQGQLNEQERDSQAPVNITVSIVERSSAETRLEIYLSICSHCECLGPRIEDMDIVVASDGSPQASDGQNNAESLVCLRHPQPKENESGKSRSVDPCWIHCSGWWLHCSHNSKMTWLRNMITQTQMYWNNQRDLNNHLKIFETLRKLFESLDSETFWEFQKHAHLCTTIRHV